ncbi:hypothetical protein [Amycolatopsis pigmentata]|uniref:Uncharacterized protein n=1 Tax=Amycolatopsis pigmentata TaxID=450801 RepID=A0ABW5FXS6_9PSEU
MVANKVSAGTGSDVRTFVSAALLTYVVGVLTLNGVILLDTGGAFLGLIVALFTVLGWRKHHGKKIFPRDIPVRSVILLAVVDIALTVLAVVLFHAT